MFKVVQKHDRHRIDVDHGSDQANGSAKFLTLCRRRLVGSHGVENEAQQNAVNITGISIPIRPASFAGICAL